MSAENVEVVGKLTDAFLRGDEATWLAFYSPDTELHKPSGRLYDPDAVYTGATGMRRAVAEHEEAFDDTRWERELLVDAGDRVVGLWHQHGRYKTDGRRFCVKVGRVYCLLDGKVVSTQRYSSWEAALESVRSTSCSS
jgi:ketosteroid isomerase-like protein